MTTLSSLTNKVPSNNGAKYFFNGLNALSVAELRLFVLMPLVINVVFFSFAFYQLMLQIDYYLELAISYLPDFLSWLSYIIWPLALFSILIIFSFCFTTIANLIAAPFNAFLSERLISLLQGTNQTSTPPTRFSSQLLSITLSVPQMLMRELQKLFYFLPRVIIFSVVLLVPVAGSIIWFLFIAWLMAIQYLDYPFDNANVPFKTMKRAITTKKPLSYSFGVSVSLCSMVPMLNLLVMPAAVCGATLIWLDHFNEKSSLSD